MYINIYIYRYLFLYRYTYILRGVNFLQRQASYCGNLGMTHKDEKWQKLYSEIYAHSRVHTPIFGLKCPYRFVQCPDGRVLKGLHWKTAQKRFLEGPKVFQIFFWGGGMLLCPP